MAKHMWLRNRFEGSTVTRAHRFLMVAIRNDMQYEDALRYVGYCCEAATQKGGGDRWMETTPFKTNHRYAKGRNRENYRVAGEKLVTEMYVMAGLDEGAPAMAIYDKLLMQGGE